ncbi:protein COFACTOR ASSEMBLY OF COMPLEX C SUBUNIT B CCB3, chloroplastic [Primulina tabacum]|uniref:protein COFACTOR ASSEMBLY OF COMPLEX C SUBUNIT B CCB3, chloroplastic n=1 Tax=Primulina tabacum TaxID=48773 RepID=UPI003F59663E
MYCLSTAPAVGILESPPTRYQILRFPHKCCARCCLRIPSSPPCDRPLLSSFSTLSADPSISGHEVSKIPRPPLLETLVLMDLDPATAKLAIGFLGPFFSAFGFLFILRIVMSWYPKLPVDKFPYVVAYAPTEPLLVQTRKLIPPLGGVDVTPVVWFGLVSFVSEILVGPQGLLVLWSQQQV